MNPLTALVFILALGSANCDDSNKADPSLEEFCMKQVEITNEERRNFKENNMKVKCYYHCMLEQNGIIVNGSYAGNNVFCKDVKDANKCELGWKVHKCRVLRSSR